MTRRRAAHDRRRSAAGRRDRGRRPPLSAPRLLRGHRCRGHRLLRQLSEIHRAGAHRDDAAPWRRTREWRQADGTAFIVRRAEIEFLAPARLDDALIVETRVVEIGGATIRLAQDVSRGKTPLVRAVVLIATIGRQGRPVRLPPALRGCSQSPQRNLSDGHRQCPITPSIKPPLAGSVPHDLSIITLFLQADTLVKMRHASACSSPRSGPGR